MPSGRAVQALAGEVVVWRSVAAVGDDLGYL